MLAREQATSEVRNPIRFLLIACILTAAVLAWLAWSTCRSYHVNKLIRERNVRIEQLRGSIIHLDEVLTMSARMAAATGDVSWETRYRRFEPQLDAAIKEAISLAPGSYGAEAAAQTDAANIALVNMEHQAFDLVRAGRMEEARTTLFSDEYEKQKSIYAAGMGKFDTHLVEAAKATLRSNARTVLLHVSSMFVVIVILAAGWVVVLRTLRNSQADLYDTNRHLARQTRELADLNLTLDQKVGERTKELAASQIAALNMMEDINESTRKVEQTNKALEAEVAERKRAEKELTETVWELQRFNRLMVDREDRMIELKREVNEMARKAGIAPPYDSAVVQAGQGEPSDA